MVRARGAASLRDAFFVLAALTPLTTTGKLPKPVALAPAAPTLPLDAVSNRAACIPFRCMGGHAG